MTTLTTTPTISDDALYSMTGDNQCPVVLTIDIETGVLDAEYHEPGLTSMRSFHGINVEWSIPALKMAPLKALMAKVSTYCQTILDGSTVEWDGSNHVGRLDDDATDAMFRVECTCDEVARDNDPNDVYWVWSAGDYFEMSDLGDFGLSAKSTDKEIESVAAVAIADAKNEGHNLDSDDVEMYLTEARDDARDEEDE